jgi:hypothetical protein
MFRKLGLFLSSGEGREARILLGPSERADLNHWIPLLSPPLRKETDPVSKTLFFLGFRIPNEGQVQKPNNSEKKKLLMFHFWCLLWAQVIFMQWVYLDDQTVYSNPLTSIHPYNKERCYMKVYQ